MCLSGRCLIFPIPERFRGPMCWTEAIQRTWRQPPTSQQLSVPQACFLNEPVSPCSPPSQDSKRLNPSGWNQEAPTLSIQHREQGQRTLQAVRENPRVGSHTNKEEEKQ